MPLTNSEIDNILKRGNFYAPAHKRYGKNVSVHCDRCHRNRLPACIGHGFKDLCLECASTCASMLYPPVRETANPIRPDAVTPAPTSPVSWQQDNEDLVIHPLMVQDVFRPPERPTFQEQFLTFMQQGIFRPQGQEGGVRPSQHGQSLTSMQQGHFHPSVQTRMFQNMYSPPSTHK